VTELIGQPEYKKIAGELRAQIASGELGIGSSIPSTAQLSRRYGLSATVVRAAINVLREEGLVFGQPGKAVYVKATPETMAKERVGIEELAQQITALRESVDDLAQRRESPSLGELREEVAELGRQVSTLQTQLIDLYGRTGQPYPHDGAAVSEDNATRRRRAAAASGKGA
jgi:DNA-binding GntR family transcriptional regulator